MARVAAVGREPRDAQHPARDGLGRASTSPTRRPGSPARAARRLAALAGERGADPFDLYFDLLAASGGEARLVNDGYGGDFQDEAPLRRLAARPDAIPETDTAVVPVHGKLTLPLPMFWGTMPRFIARFSRDLAARHAARRRSGG